MTLVVRSRSAGIPAKGLPFPARGRGGEFLAGALSERVGPTAHRSSSPEHLTEVIFARAPLNVVDLAVKIVTAIVQPNKDEAANSAALASFRLARLIRHDEVQDRELHDDCGGESASSGQDRGGEAEPRRSGEQSGDDTHQRAGQHDDDRPQTTAGGGRWGPT